MDVTFETKFKNKAGTDEWLTPPKLLSKLGEFDLDPCSPIIRPWDTAKHHFNINDDGLSKDWEGRVWCNPPYGDKAIMWLAKCAEHKNAMALTFARTETRMFFNTVWDKAAAVLFIKGRLKFYTVDGVEGSSAGAPSVLIAYDDYNANILKNSGILGKFIWINN